MENLEYLGTQVDWQEFYNAYQGEKISTGDQVYMLDLEENKIYGCTLVRITLSYVDLRIGTDIVQFSYHNDRFRYRFFIQEAN